MDLKAKIQLKKFIHDLEKIRGRHTELVSVYAPTGYDLIKVIQHLQEEQGTAKNIKDAKTRQNVIDSLERCIRHLRLFKQTPPNGIAIFAGNVAAQEGKVDIQIFSIEPPQPLKTRIYRCDQTFVLDLLREQLEDRQAYGLIVMDRREATIGVLRGTAIIVKEHLTSGVPGKIKAGGQSAPRFQRIIEGMAIEFYKRIAEVCNKEFLPIIKDLKGIILGGPGPTKESFHEYLNNEIKRKIVAVQDLTYTDESGLRDLVEKSRDILAKEAVTEEINVMQQFFTFLAKTPDKVTYGEIPVRKALEKGAVDILLISEEIDARVIEELEKVASNFGTNIRLISTETREGQQLKDLGGLAAILRYSMDYET